MLLGSVAGNRAVADSPSYANMKCSLIATAYGVAPDPEHPENVVVKFKPRSNANQHSAISAADCQSAAACPPDTQCTTTNFKFHFNRKGELNAGSVLMCSCYKHNENKALVLWPKDVHGQGG